MDRKLPRCFAMSPVEVTALAGLLLIAPAGFPATASAQQADPGHADMQERREENDRDSRDDTLERAGHIATQPVRDVGITKDRIPRVLQEAVDDTYAPPPRESCAWLNYELARLDQALGPDFDAEVEENEDKVERLALAGGEMIVNSIIPFRGLVREISGAAPAERRRLAAVNAGLARRGYIRGLAKAKDCAIDVRTAAR